MSNIFSPDKSLFKNAKDLSNNTLSGSGLKDKTNFDTYFKKSIIRSKNRKNGSTLYLLIMFPSVLVVFFSYSR